MDKDDNKQVEDALQAIKKLVELSESKLSSDDEVINLDNVVWRNPVSDSEELPTAPPVSSPTPTSLSVSSYDLNKTKLKGDEQVLPRQAIQVPHDSELQARQSAPQTEVTQKAPYVPAIEEPSVALNAPDVMADEPHQKLPIDVAGLSDDIRELTEPLGRRGGGFYSDGVKAPSPKPIIVTSPLEKPKSVSHAPSMTGDKKQSVMPESKVSQRSSESVVEPAITDFQGADFNFSPAEGLMTATDFEEMAQFTSPIIPDVQVPIADPPVENPVDEVQLMFQSSQDEEHHATGQPNLHVVSDQTFDEESDEDNGFSGDVRMALRSLIREQVSTWLQGNMTGLIEEALSSPNKKPSSKSRSKTTKR